MSPSPPHRALITSHPNHTVLAGKLQDFLHWRNANAPPTSWPPTARARPRPQRATAPLGLPQATSSMIEPGGGR